MARMDQADSVDVLVIGGGATGLGCAVDAASRGYRTVLLEAAEFGSGTSSRSTKLIHGGVRYLAQGQIGLVREALAERAILHRNAPDLVRPLGIILPVANPLELAYYTIGLKFYDALAGRANLEPSRPLSASRTFERVPNLRRDRTWGGVRFVDAQFDDLAFARALAFKARELGAVLRENVRVTGMVQVDGKIRGVVAYETLSGASVGEEIRFDARVVVNAAGVWCDEMRRLSDPEAKTMLAPSRGSHLILPAEFLGGVDGFIVPKTDDGRVIFALPWKSGTLVGTTDVAVSGPDANPQPTEEEIDYLLEHFNRYVERPATRADIVGTFAGLRPLLGAGATKTAALSREHLVNVDAHGLVTIAGGKWTTYRRMAKDAIDVAARSANLPARASRTLDLPLKPV